ncbi:MAG: hypothetical protein ACPGWM_04830 [Flavobacteriales bacterium]
MKIHHLHFSININSTPKAIWNALWNDQLYRKWASVFFEGSYMRCDEWKAGHTVFFLGPDQSGIYSTIEAYVPNKTIRFKHIGKVKKGEKLAVDKETKLWSGSNEAYTILEGSEHHTLSVEIDVMDEHLEFMKGKFPEALGVIKSNC